VRLGEPARIVPGMRRADGLAGVACRDGPPGHAGPVGRFCPWREKGKERNGSNGERLAGRGLPWLAEATMCGALNSPAGLTFLSLRGAAPASSSEPFHQSDPITIHIRHAQPFSVSTPPHFLTERGVVTRLIPSIIYLRPSRPTFYFTLTAAHRAHPLLTRGHPKELCPVAADQKHLRLPLMV
jgi:hypothetical protein